MAWRGRGGGVVRNDRGAAGVVLAGVQGCGGLSRYRGALRGTSPSVVRKRGNMLASPEREQAQGEL